MGKEKTTRTVKLEKHESDSSPMIMVKVKTSVPRLRTVKPKEKIKVSTMKSSSTTDRCNTTCETSGNIMKLCVNLMPVLALAKEPVEEEEEDEKNVNSCTNEKKPEGSSKKDPSFTKLLEKTLNTSNSYTGVTLIKTNEIKRRPSPGFVLPPLTQPKPAPECCGHQKTKMCFTPLPTISLFDQRTTISPNLTTTGCRGVGDSGPWIDNPLFSKCRSAEFRLPDISLSSLDALLQTVSQKLGRKRRGGDEEPWRRVQSDHTLMAVKEQRLKEQMVGQLIDHSTEERNRDIIGAATETSVLRETRLPPLISAPKAALILTMTKKTC